MALKVAFNGWFLRRPDTGSGQYLIHLLEEFRKPEYGVSADVVEPPTQGDVAKLRFEQWEFPKAARGIEAEIAHVPYFGSAVRPRLPTVVTIHDLIPLVVPAYHGSAKVRLYTRLVAWAARQAKAIIADSEASRRDIVRLLSIDECKVHVIYLAADERYQPVSAPAALDAVRNKYGLPEQFVLYLGGFDQRKNVLNLVRAFAKVARGLGSDVALVLAGRPPQGHSSLFPDMHALIDELELSEQVRFIGEVSEDEKPTLYSLASCFAWPSYYEGFGLPVLEAMACGTPVVAADTSSLPEIVGDAGFLVQSDSVNRMAGAIIASLIDENLRQEHRAKGLAQAAKFSWQQCARATVQVYQAVLQH